jgi:hypothetical protein
VYNLTGVVTIRKSAFFKHPGTGMWRHGDVFIQLCDGIPKDAHALKHVVLAKGEITGHAHQIEPRGAARLFENSNAMYLQVTARSATVIHEEHAPIELGKGTYRVWIQREYSPEEIRRVVD